MNIQKCLIPQPISAIRGLSNAGLSLFTQFVLGKDWVLVVVILGFAFAHMAIGVYFKVYEPGKFQDVNYPYSKKAHWKEGFIAGAVCLGSAQIVGLGLLAYFFLVPGIKESVWGAENPQAVINGWLWVVYTGFAIMAVYIYHWGRLMFYHEAPAPSRIKLRNRKK